ncbi:MAG TPA: gephyrin-like molybdotransferase Glp [Bryobacteraceae bacterium]|nr:gephyrin-like molybdotransferase Glp [Bryobacteraceae bacterium]
MILTFDQAREIVVREVGLSAGAQPILLGESEGRVLAEEILADRDYPPFPRSARDGFAIRAADAPGELRVLGQVRAGETFSGAVGPGEAVEIMTGAPLPEGADAVVMVEHAERTGERVRVRAAAKPGDNFTKRGADACASELVLHAGRRIGFAEAALLASMGRSAVVVYGRPQVAILPTGDELVELSESPSITQIRNSNAISLAFQVRRAGGIPQILPIARDNAESTRRLIEQGLKADLLLVSGGVSAGKYDLVKTVLAELGAKFFFERVAMQPGQPLAFGKAQGKYFFGLPGNPGSTMITFETIARAALEKMQGIANPVLPLLKARLSKPFAQKTGLTRFLPANLSPDGATVEGAVSGGSGDLPALARCNAFLVTDANREAWAAGEDIRVLVK